MINGNGCLVTVEGHYFALAGSVDRKKVKKAYRIRVKVAAPEGALSVIKNKLLDRVLAKLYPDYHTYHTHEITGITDLQGQTLMGYTNVRIMNFNQIANYVKINNLPLKLELYTELDTLRTMVFLAETNAVEFERKQILLESEAKEDAILAELNPELFDRKKPIAIPIVEDVPKIEPDKKVQHVDQTWDSKQGKYVPTDEFVEDFDRPEEKPYGEDVIDSDAGVGNKEQILSQNPPEVKLSEQAVASAAAQPSLADRNQGTSLMDEL